LLKLLSACVAGAVAPAQRKISIGYNAAGDISLVTDALGQEARLATDALGRQTGSTDPLG
jgi:YD repeat-containing protein